MKLNAIVMAMPRQVVKMTKLEQMLKYVSEHNDFYKKRIKEYGISNPLDITQWPVLTRKELQENRYNMFSDGYESKYFFQQLHRQTSSGSSGIPINVYWDFNNLYASNLSLWRKRKKYYSIKPNDKYVIFNLFFFDSDITQEESLYYDKSIPNVMLVNISLVHKNDKYTELLDIIEKYQPIWLYIQPYILSRIIDAYQENNMSPPNTIKYIELYGEMVPPSLIERASSIFKVPIANMYGSEEMNGIAYECQNNHLHVLEDNVLVECLYNENVVSFGEGESIITNLNNYAMPLIRYNQGDIISISKLKKICNYDKNTVVINSIKGRKYDEIELKNGYVINTFLLQEIIAEVNNQCNDLICAYRYIYIKSENILKCIISVKNNNWYNSVKKMINNVYKCKINSAELDFQIEQEWSMHNFEKKYKILEKI